MPHRDPAGFALDRPEGWTVEAPAPTQVAVWDPRGRAGALIRGRTARGDLAQWLARAYPATEGVGDAAPLSVEAVGPDAARAAFRFTGPDGRPRRANAVAVRRGEVATVFVAVAPEEEFAGALPVLSAVLDSFRLGAAPPAGAAAAALPPMVRWTDPAERAFTVEVPRDWRVSGGLHRRGGPATQGRATFTVASPDGGRIVLFVGDPAVPAFVVPSQLTASLGHREGQPVSPGGPVLMRFRHAAEVGPELLQRRFGAVEVTGRRDRPDISEHRRRNQPVMQGSVGLMSAGDVEFRLPDGRRGAATLTTAGYDVPGLTGGWTVEEVYGFVAPPEAAGLAGATLARVVGSFAVNPAWFANETRMASVDSGRWLEYLRGSAALQQRTLEQRWAVQDAQAAARGDVLSGTVRLVDPRTGEQFTAQAGSRYFYRVLPDPQRPAVVGVEVDASPEPRIEMRRLLQMGVDVPYR